MEDVLHKVFMNIRFLAHEMLSWNIELSNTKSLRRLVDQIISGEYTKE